MSAMPPELPPLSAPRPSASFVTVIAWIAFVLALLGMLYGVSQTISGLFMPKDFFLRAMNPAGRALSLPPYLQWVFTHTLILGIIELLMSSLFAWVAWNLRKRRNWARIAFVAFLLMGMLWQFAGLWMMPQTIDGTLNMQASMLPPGQTMPDGMKDIMRMAMLVGGIFNLAVAALLGWVAWKLCSRKLRAEFS
jgi:hypothetical protein